MELGQDKLIAVGGLDGIIRARQENDNLGHGQNVANTELEKYIKSAPQGTLVAASMLDGVQRVRSYRVMEEYPLVVLVGISTEAAFTAFEQRKHTIIMEGILAGLFLMAMCALLIERTEKALRESKERYSSLMDTVPDGFALCKMIFVKGQPQDLVYLEINSAFEKLTGLKDITGKRITEIIPGIRESNPGFFDIGAARPVKHCR